MTRFLYGHWISLTNYHSCPRLSYILYCRLSFTCICYILFSTLFLKLHLLFDKKKEKKLPSMSSPKTEEVITVDVKQAKTLLQSGHQYLDVRTQEEFRRGHCQAPKIVNIPYMLSTPQGRVKNEDFLDQVSSLLNPADDIIVGCQSGARSLTATTELLAAGFKKVRNMRGGYMSWVDHSFAINKEEPSAN
ncbi:Thiosulfate sulfurtransferase 18 [Cardamine amara subsp. amara]|uniref:Thiosulfate sulfurtransferase 18 n=1 Tax=Cardamine amara subsp. amara TaxID=228776 RepID=A0ABD1BGD2_CARAN